MKTLLLNKNPVISKLVRMSAQKVEYEFEERSAYSGDIGEFDIIIIDDGVNADLNELKAKCKTLICISSAASASEDGKQILHKPFLPTDLIALMRNDELLSEANAGNSASAPDNGEQGLENAAAAEGENVENAADEDEIDLDSLSFDNKLLEPENSTDGAENDGGALGAQNLENMSGENGAENETLNLGDGGAETAAAADYAANSADTAAANSIDENNIYLQDITGESAENSASTSENGAENSTLENGGENSAQNTENSATNEKKDELAFTPVDFDTKLDFDFNSLAPSGETALNSDIADKILANIESENLGLSGENADISNPLNSESAASESVLNGENLGNNENSLENESVASADISNSLNTETAGAEKSSQITLDDESASTGGESQIKLENDESTIGNESQIALDNETTAPSSSESSANADDTQLSSNESSANDDEKALTDDEPLEFDAQDLAEITEGLDLKDFEDNKQPSNADETGEQNEDEQKNAPKKSALSAEKLAKATFLQPLNEPINEEASVEKAEIQGENLQNTENLAEISQNENAETSSENLENEVENTENLNENLENEAENLAQNLTPETSETMENSITEPNEPAFSVEEKEEGKMSFDDLPENASFLGQKNSENIDPQDIKPILVDEKPAAQSTQDLVKEQLADLNAMDEEFEQDSSEQSAENQSENAPQSILNVENSAQNAIINEQSAENSAQSSIESGDSAENSNEIPQNEPQNAQIPSQTAPNAEILDDLQGLNESEIQVALGESPKAQQKDSATQSNSPKPQNTATAELASELSRGVSGAITSSISDNALKAALKGMKMHIDINIKFDEE